MKLRRGNNRNCLLIGQKTVPDVIVVGLLPRGGGLELLSWTIHVLARPGDVVVALIVSYPFSTIVIVEREIENGVDIKNKGAPQLQLGELRELCHKKQIQMDVKFAVGENSEKVVIEQASTLNASTLVISPSDRLAPWRKRSRGSYCVRNAPPGCSVVIVRDGKIMYYKDNPFKVPSEDNEVSSTEDMQLLHLKQLWHKERLRNSHIQCSSSFKAQEVNGKAKCKTSSEETNECSPRGVLEGSSSLRLDSDSSSSLSSTSSHSSSKKALLTSHWEDENDDKGFQCRPFLCLWKHCSMRRLSIFPPRIVPKNLGTSWSPLRSDTTNDNSLIGPQISRLNKDSIPFSSKPSWKCFTFQELQSATNNFVSENFIGKGGYAEVYKGSLADGQLVAVKRLTRGQTEEHRVHDFLTELGIIVHINHPNTAHLIGFGVEGGLHLVFQFSPHGSLASMLHGTKSKLLDWDIRYRVALGTAQGLLYLHEGCQRRIIHRDIKASNILLTETFEPQISDFGLAKWLPKQWTHHTITPIEGTFGYLAPEYFMHGIVDEKTDVFSFGVLLLELITGRLPINSSQQSLVMWAKPFLECRNIQELVDPRLSDAYDVQQMNFMVLTAALCVQQVATLRPSMRHVLQLLNGEGDKLQPPETWRMPLLQLPYLQESLDADEYTSTRYLTDMSRHREVALEF